MSDGKQKTELIRHKKGQDEEEGCLPGTRGTELFPILGATTGVT